MDPRTRGRESGRISAILNTDDGRRGRLRARGGVVERERFEPTIDAVPGVVLDCPEPLNPRAQRGGEALPVAAARTAASLRSPQCVKTRIVWRSAASPQLRTKASSAASCSGRNRPQRTQKTKASTPRGAWFAKRAKRAATSLAGSDVSASQTVSITRHRPRVAAAAPGSSPESA